MPSRQSPVIPSAISAHVENDLFNKRFNVAGGSKATYVFRSFEVVKGNVIEIVTQRIGSSGLSFSKRIVDCKASTFRYVVSGAATLDEAIKGKMEPLTDGSVSSILGYAACTSLALPKLSTK